MDNKVGRSFARQKVRDAVIPAYMGLIKQIDDQMGVLFQWLEDTGRMEDTMIVLTSDHGDFLGDHWLGEKTFFHDASTRVPLIIYDPSPEADATRGTVSDALVEAIDLAPTFLDVAGGEPVPHIMEGQSLLPILHGEATETHRDVVICQFDYSHTPLADKLGVSVPEAVMFMVANRKWKLIHCDGGFPPILFDLENDPDELVDLGTSNTHAPVIAEMYEHLAKWGRRQSQRQTQSQQWIFDSRTNRTATGVVLGAWDENDQPLRATEKYRGRKAKPFSDCSQ
jgi:arylsulfatase A-like enzyme